MAKYSDIAVDLETALAGLTGTPVLPSSFPGPSGANKYAKFSIIYGGDLGNQFKSFGIRGQLIIDIFTLATSGGKDGQDIADSLDVLLQGKVFNNGTQTSGSLLVDRGIDPDNSALNRMIYTLPFTHE